MKPIRIPALTIVRPIRGLAALYVGCGAGSLCFQTIAECWAQRSLTITTHVERASVGDMLFMLSWFAVTWWFGFSSLGFSKIKADGEPLQ